MPPEADDYFKEKIQAATQSISRARTVFLISNLASIIVVAANFNLYFSWLRNMIERPVVKNGPYEEVLKAIAHARIEDTAIISVPLVGVKFFAADIGILSALTMLVLSVWIYYSLRREQHTVARIAAEVLEGGDSGDFSACTVPLPLLDKAQYLLYSISAAFVFTTSTRGRLAIGDPARASGPVKAEPKSTKWMAVILIWAPLWTVLLSLALDIGSMFFPSALLSGPRLNDVLMHKQEIEALIRFAVTGAFAVLIGRIVANASYYSKWTSRVYDTLARAVDDAEAVERASREGRPR
jgi:hypothetical protein